MEYIPRFRDMLAEQRIKWHPAEAGTSFEHDIIDDALGGSVKSGVHSTVRARASNEMSDLSKSWEDGDSDGWRQEPLVPL